MSYNKMDKFSPFCRQALVAATSHLAGFSVGAMTAYPIVLLQQLPTDPNVVMDLDSSSWIASVHGIAGILSIFITPIMQWRGRRFAFIISTLIIISGWTLISIANKAFTIIIGESFHGIGYNSAVIVGLVTISEMIEPKYRNLSMLLFAILQEAGAIFVTIVGHFLHYKTVAIVMCVPSILSLIFSFIWPDSPSWLAYKGDFERCEQIFTWLRGSSEYSKRELDSMIFAQKETLRKKALKRQTVTKRGCMKNLFEKITQKDFYLPMICMLLIMTMYFTSGSLVIFLYGPSIVQSITGITNPLICIILLDVALGIGSVLAIIMEQRLKNKQIFLIGGISCTIFLLFSCIVTYLHSASILQKDSILFLFCFFGFILSNFAGFTQASFNVSAELIPVKHRGLGGAIYLVSMCGFHTLSIKTAPYLFIHLNIWGSFGLYFIFSVLGNFLLWKYIPETKNRTLQEIEDYFNYGEFRTIKAGRTDNVPFVGSE